ncbi:MAG: MFS transporter [Pseudomonadota bacterium]
MHNAFHKRGTNRQPNRWGILALLWLLYFSFGVVTRSPSPLVTPLLKDLNMTYSQMGFVLGSWQLTYIALAIMAGVIMDRWGIRKSILAGALIIGLSASLRSLSIGFGTFLVFIALSGAGSPMISIGCPKTIAQLFKGKERGTAVGIYTTGPWIGAMASLAATNGMIMPLLGYSWRLTFVFYGVMTFLFAGLWWFYSNDADAVQETEQFNFVRVLVHLFKVHNVRMILLSGLLSFGIMHGYFAWLPKILENAGMSPARAGIASSIPFLSSIPAVLTIPRIIPHRSRGICIGLLALMASLGILWVVAWKWPVILGLIIFGVSGPCLMPLLVLTLMETPEVTSKYLGSATGVFFCVSEIGGFFGPFIVGFLADLAENFLAGAIFLSSLGLIILVFMSLLKTAPNQSG